MFYLFAALASVAVLTAWGMRGARMALAVCWAAAMICPGWIYANFGPLRIDMPFYSAAVTLGICILTRERLVDRLIWADFVLLLLLVVELVTEAYYGHFRLSLLIGLFIRWIVPYACGRILIRSYADLDRLTTAAIGVCLVLAAWGTLESVTRVNPITFIISHRGSLNAEQDFRWGLRRAEGPFSHPITFGEILVLLVPWALLAARDAWLGLRHRWLILTPLIIAGAVFFTMSRGPQLAFLMAMYGFAVMRMPQIRRKLLIGGMCGAVVLGLGYQTALAVLRSATNEEPGEHFVIRLRGQDYVYSGTNHRYLQLLVFEKAVWNAGWLGYGIDQLLNHMEDLPLESSLPGVFRSVDNQYLLQVLKSGFLGLFVYIAVIVTALYQLYRPAMTTNSIYSPIAAGLFCAVAAIALVQTTVWLSPDMAFFWLFTFGVASGVREQFNLSQQVASESHEASSHLPDLRLRRRIQPRLTPGHPSLELSS